MSNLRNQTGVCRQLIDYAGETSRCGGKGVERNLFHLHYECEKCGSEWTTQEQREREAAEPA